MTVELLINAIIAGLLLGVFFISVGLEIDLVALTREPFSLASAIALAKRESKLNAATYNWCCVGLFQINWWAHKPWLKNMGITKASQLLDAKTNARAALEMYKRSGGWSPWDL